MAAKFQRSVDNRFLNSGLDASSIEYNPASGAKKTLNVGPRLIPIPVAGGLFSTNITTRTAMPNLGSIVAIYNNAGTVGSVTIGNIAITALAVGVTDTSGNVGVACAPNTWTYLAMGNNMWIIGSASTLLTYIVEDPTFIVQQSAPLVQQNNGNTQPIS